MFGRMMGEKYYCGIDMGAQTVKAGVLKIRGAADMELVGVCEQPTHGLKDNAVSDLAEFAECVHHTVDELAKRTGIKFKEIHLGLGGAMITVRPTNTVIPLTDRGDKVITRRDIKKVNDHARLLGIKVEEEILHDLPQYYKVDDVNSALNPLGLCGRKLGVHSLLVVVNANRIRNIMRAVHQAGYDAANVFFSSYVSSDVILDDAEKKEGCVLVDIGSQHTTVLVFRDGVLQFLEGIDIGGRRFTRDIADRLNLPFDLAEEIKKSYAAASGFDRHQNEDILVKREGAYIPVKRGVIYEAIKPDIEELVERIRKGIARSGMKDQVGRGMAIIGGGALLPGLIEQIGRAIQVPVKLGHLNLPLRKNLSHTAVFASVVGLALSGFQRTLRYAVSPKGHAPWTQRFANWVKELYQEYF